MTDEVTNEETDEVTDEVTLAEQRNRESLTSLLSPWIASQSNSRDQDAEVWVGWVVVEVRKGGGGSHVG